MTNKPCSECKHRIPAYAFLQESSNSYCHSPEVDFVKTFSNGTSAKLIQCVAERADRKDSVCGPEGKYFEQASSKTKRINNLKGFFSVSNLPFLIVMSANFTSLFFALRAFIK